MKTLFLNPNSSGEITATLRRHIERSGWPDQRWDVRKVENAPRIIGSLALNAEAEAALERELPALSAGFDRIVMMSSLDTGYEIARQRFGDATFGFTRSVLAQHRGLDQQLQIVTFDKDMTQLYERAFEVTGHRAVVASWTVLDLMPASVAAQPQVALDELRAVCCRLATASTHQIFVVGAVGLALAAQLRRDGMNGIIDPVADLVKWLGAA
jgi:Asp/Glu/hydantoin racemase